MSTILGLALANLGLSLLLAALSLVVVCWLYLIARALGSHINTQAISESTNTLHAKSKFNFPFVSIIVPARNEQDGIEKCLLSLLNQNYPGYEVIAVDDNSTDGTLGIMKRMELAFGGRLKVVSVKDKPKDWTGKTWASQMGYLHSNGRLLLFTDADSHFESKNVITLTVGKMLSENLDVLTGVPYLPLKDFWSKTVMPVWNLYSEVFDHGIADVNDSKSKVAFVMGSFFLIKKVVFEEIGTYDSVKLEIQEDRAIGLLLKEGQYKMKMFKINSLVSALWSRDLHTLWHGIRRSVAPLAIKDKFTVVSHQLMMFVMVALPFLLLPYSIVLSDNNSASTINQPALALFLLDSLLCLLIITVTSIKGVMKYRLVPMYSVLCFVASLFLVACYAYSTIPFLTGSAKSIPWKGRAHDIVLNNKTKQTVA